MGELTVMRLAATAALLLLLTCCGNTVDNWAAEQAERLTQAGVTYPPEQERNTVIALTTACPIRDVSATEEDAFHLFVSTTPLASDWISQADAVSMWRLATPEFCGSIPDGPLAAR